MEKRRMERRFAAIQLSVLFERQKIATKTVPRRVEHPSLRTSSSFAFSDFRFLREMTGFGLSHSTYGLPASRHHGRSLLVDPCATRPGQEDRLETPGVSPWTPTSVQTCSQCFWDSP